MATVRPFHALRPAAASAARVSAVPYDVVTTAEARALAGGNPLSFLHVSRAEIDLPDGTDPHADAVYERAAENFERVKRDAPFARDAEPALYLYRLRSGDHVQTGVAGCGSLDEYDSGVVRRHERTRRDKEDDRTRHMLRLAAQTGPVFLTFRDAPEIDALVAQGAAAPPLYDFTAPDGVAHTLWRLSPSASAAVEAAFRRVPRLYVADGHHRAASAARARAERRAAGGAGAERAAADGFLAVAFPAGQVRILAYNRVVRDLNGRSPEAFLAELSRALDVAAAPSGAPGAKGEVRVYLAGRWHAAALRPPAESGAIAALDADRLQRQVLEPLLAIRDVRTDPRIEFVGGIRGPAELERLVDSGHAAVAFSLAPVSMDELLAVSDADEIMPPKSTWFEPKLRDGLLIHEI